MEVQLSSLKAGWDANVGDYHHYSVIPHEMAGSLQSMAGSLLSMSFMRFWGMAGKIGPRARALAAPQPLH